VQADYPLGELGPSAAPTGIIIGWLSARLSAGITEVSLAAEQETGSYQRATAIFRNHFLR
jgi:hypothetical protein